MAKTLHRATAISLFLLAEVCAADGLEDVQRTEPIRTTKFTGIHNTVARCIYDRVGGRMKGAEFGVVGDRLVLYDSERGLSTQGLTYYSITIQRTGLNQGVVEWRIIRSEARADYFRKELSIGPLTEAMVQRFWIPAQECADQARIAP